MNLRCHGWEDTQPYGCWGLLGVLGISAMSDLTPRGAAHPGAISSPWSRLLAAGSWGAASRQAHPAGVAATFPWQRCRMR